MQVAEYSGTEAAVVGVADGAGVGLCGVAPWTGLGAPAGSSALMAIDDDKDEDEAYFEGDDELEDDDDEFDDFDEFDDEDDDGGEDGSDDDEDEEL